MVKASWGKYLDQIGTGTPGPNPNGAVSQRYTWNDSNGDLQLPAGQRDVGRHEVRRRRVRRAGEQQHDDSEPESGSIRATATYRNEVTAGIDRELFPGVRGSITYIRKREHDPTATVECLGVNGTRLTIRSPSSIPGRTVAPARR